MSASYLKRQIREAMTGELADELYMKSDAPLERLVNDVVGTPDEGRLSVFDYQQGLPSYLVAYTLNDGNVFVHMIYKNFGVTDDCDISLDIIFSKLAHIAKKIIATGTSDTTVNARGGLGIKVRDGEIKEITYWSQLTKGLDTIETDVGTTDITQAYAFLKEQCTIEQAHMKANADQHVRNLLMDGILDAAKIQTDN